MLAAAASAIRFPICSLAFLIFMPARTADKEATPCVLFVPPYLPLRVPDPNQPIRARHWEFLLLVWLDSALLDSC